VPLHHWRQLELAGTTVYLHRTDPVGGGGYFVMGDSAAKETVWVRLAGAGMVPTGDDAFDYLRIASGLPRFGREITDEYIPLETGLWADVSFNKGCYTGQEVIARMESRGRLAKKLVRFRAAAPVAAGTAIEAGGRNAGTITSAAEGPGGVLALGYLKTRVLGDGPDTDEASETLSAGGVPLQLLE
jgi:tRNA-modifying protein YgfZ